MLRRGEMGETVSPLNILLVCIDDLRADRLSFMGNMRETSPNLARRRAGATLFRNCHSPVGWTLPGCASIITGLEPDAHGLVNHDHRFRSPKLGHCLGQAYHRVAIANNGNLVPDHIDPHILSRLGLERKPDKWRRFGWGEGFDEYRWWSREQTREPFESAVAFLRNARADQAVPWLLFFHSNVVHDYHLDRACYLDADWTRGGIHAALHNTQDGPELWSRLPADLPQGTAKQQFLRKYDAGILAMDRLLERLLLEVDFETTLVVFTSDHGEGFEPEVGRIHHCGRLHNDLTHVPLLVWLPSRLKERYDSPAEELRSCSTVDIVPTLLELTDHPLPPLSGRFLFDLPNHRVLRGSDRGYVFWGEDGVRESYDKRTIEIESELCYPLKRISVRRDGELREYEYHLAYDPGERENLLEDRKPSIRGLEPVSFVVAVNDFDELRWNLLSSPLAGDPRHQWILVDNRSNAEYERIAELYADGLDRADNDLVFFLHQDVFLPHGWDLRVHAVLSELEQLDPAWGVVGAVGMPVDCTAPIVGHWSDPHGYHCHGPLPHKVQSLDELWLGLRKSRGVAFDRQLPGFHCYGVDLCMTARQMGLNTYAIDAFLWHKYRDSKGELVATKGQSCKIRERWSDTFMAGFRPAADYVGEKWARYRPFRSTTWEW